MSTTDYTLSKKQRAALNKWSVRELETQFENYLGKEIKLKEDNRVLQEENNTLKARNRSLKRKLEKTLQQVKDLNDRNEKNESKLAATKVSAYLGDIWYEMFGVESRPKTKEGEIIKETNCQYCDKPVNHCGQIEKLRMHRIKCRKNGKYPRSVEG